VKWFRTEARRLLEARVTELLEERVATRAEFTAALDRMRDERDEARRELASLTDRVLARQGFGKPAPQSEATTTETKDEKPVAYETLADTQARIARLESEGKLDIVDGRIVLQ